MATITGTDLANVLFGTENDDSIFGKGGNDLLYGGSGKDSLKGGGGDDTLFGGNDDDTLHGGAGADDLHGGSGRDAASYVNSSVGVFVSLISGIGVYGDADGDTLEGIENLTGSSHDDVLWGDDTTNFLKGNGGDDTLKGGGGVDFIEGGAGADFIDGGSSQDTARYTSSSVGVFVSLKDGIAAYGDAEGDTLTRIENLGGSAHDDELWGDDGLNGLSGEGGADTLKGFGGGDYLDGGAGADTLWGGDGNDTLNGGAGADTMRGEADNDTYYVDNAGDVVIELAGQGIDAVYTTFNYTLGANVENLGAADGKGTSALNLTGNALDNFIWGNDGVNVIDGGNGNDTLHGYNGNDTLYGGGGNDTLYGDNGTDTIYGGLGADTFGWISLTELTGTLDVLADFNAAQGDKIDVHAIDANETLGGNQDFVFIGGASFSAAGQIRFGTDGVNTYIALNTDADFIDNEAVIQISGVVTPDASWFVV